METEGEELKSLLLIHLNRGIIYRKKLGAKIVCENFSCFYGESRDSRCLLDEYSNKEGKNYFSIEEIREICPYFRVERATKCKNNGYLIPGKIPPQKELEGLINKFIKRHEVEDKKLADKSL